MSDPPKVHLLSQLLEQAIVHHQRGQMAEAERAYRRVINAKSDHVEALHLFGILRFQQGHQHEALELIGLALRLEPRNAAVLYNRGNILAQLKQYEEAIASYDKSLAVIPENLEAYHNRGNSLLALTRFEEAVASYDRAIAIKPNYAEALDSRGNALRLLNRFEEALASYDQALAINPGNACTHNNRGNALLALGRHDEALQSYHQAFAIDPDFIDTLLNRGHALMELERFEEALACYGRAQVMRPDCAEAHMSEANCRLLFGDFDRGWEKYEWRWKTEQWRKYQRNFSQPLWLGKEDITGKTILLYSEGGFGDTLLFCRYAKSVSERGARVILEVQPSLKQLLSTVEGPHIVLARGEPLPHFDFQCPLMSLARAFNTRLDTIRGECPYLRAPAERIEQWRARLPQTDSVRVGLVWSTGQAERLGGGNRSLSFKRLAPLLSVDRAYFVSLHRERDLSPEDAEAVASNDRVVDFGREQPDFLDAAAIISSLDLVISVDTALSNLAGALGVPVWIMLPFVPEGRWLLKCGDTRWYPTARFFRQPQSRDWESVLVQVARELRRWNGRSRRD